MNADRALTVRVLRTRTQTDDLRALETTYDIYAPLYQKDLRPSREALRIALDELAATNPRAAGADVDRMLELRFVDELARSGFVERLYGR